MSDLKKFLSYLVPIRIKNYQSVHSGNLQINLIDGVRTLDTTNSNYSFGSLQRILFQGLKKIHFNDEFNSILILGLGGGSVIQTIREKFNSQAKIDVVEIDMEIINIARSEFNIGRFQNVKVINDDAFNYVTKCDLSYDLIVVDLFIGNRIPEVFFTKPFLRSINYILNKNGKLIYNLMRDTIENDVKLNIINVLKESGLTISIYEQIENTNDLIIGTKSNTQ